MEATTKTSQRNYGIDLLRLVAAFYVIILHSMYQGGLFLSTTPGTYQNYICKVLLIFSFCAVNIFGIVSGYVGYRETEKRFSFTGYLSLWIDVVFYGVILTLLFMYLRPGTVTVYNMIDMFYPITKNQYWYFSAYSMVYFLTPFLNRMIRHSSEKELKYLFFLIVFIIVPLEFIGRSFSMSQGYSSLWLILLYLIGAIMKKTGIGSGIRPVTAIFSILLLNICLFFLNKSHPGISILNIYFDFTFEYNATYVSPFFLASAILHVILFSKLRVNTPAKKLIAFAAPAAFAVYIVNVQESVWLYFMKDRFVSWVSYTPVMIVLHTVCFSFLFVLSVVLADFCRRKLFRFLKIYGLLEKLESIFQKAAIG